MACWLSHSFIHSFAIEFYCDLLCFFAQNLISLAMLGSHTQTHNQILYPCVCVYLAMIMIDIDICRSNTCMFGMARGLMKCQSKKERERESEHPNTNFTLKTTTTTTTSIQKKIKMETRQTASLLSIHSKKKCLNNTNICTQIVFSFYFLLLLCSLM